MPTDDRPPADDGQNVLELDFSDPPRRPDTPFARDSATEGDDSQDEPESRDEPWPFWKKVMFIGVPAPTYLTCKELRDRWHIFCIVFPMLVFYMAAFARLFHEDEIAKQEGLSHIRFVELLPLIMLTILIARFRGSWFFCRCRPACAVCLAVLTVRTPLVSYTLRSIWLQHSISLPTTPSRSPYPARGPH